MAAAQQVRGRRLSEEARREQLLELGVELFGQHSYEDVSIDGLALQAGISKGLLYHYFGSKRLYYVAVVREATDQLLEALAVPTEGDPEERLRLALEGWFDKPISKLPKKQRKRYERDFFLHTWDELTPERRRMVAKQYDDQHDPNNSEQAELDFKQGFNKEEERIRAQRCLGKSKQQYRYLHLDLHQMKQMISQSDIQDQW